MHVLKYLLLNYQNTRANNICTQNRIIFEHQGHLDLYQFISMLCPLPYLTDLVKVFCWLYSKNKKLDKHTPSPPYPTDLVKVFCWLYARNKKLDKHTPLPTSRTWWRYSAGCMQGIKKLDKHRIFCRISAECLNYTVRSARNIFQTLNPLVGTSVNFL